MSDDNSSNKSKKVSFDIVEVREYVTVLSTNPASRGPALELGWTYQPAEEIKDVRQQATVPCHGPIALNEYERIRPSSHRRKRKQFYLHFPQRVNRLKPEYSDEEIVKAEIEKKKINKSRKRNNFWRSPLVMLKQDLAQTARDKKIKRAIRNLKKKEKNENIYSGWWLPLSAFVL